MSKPISMSVAYGNVATSEEWTTYRETMVSSMEAFEGTLAAFKSDDTKVSELSGKNTINSNLRRKFEERIIANLVSGKWSATGHVIPRRPEDDKYQIPQDVWSNFPAINWEESKVKGQGLAFINVTLAMNQSMKMEKRSEARKPTGRPTVRPNIIEAYESLKAAGKIDFSKPKSAINGPICTELSQRYPERTVEFNNLEESTIRKAISKLFDLDKKKLGRG